MADEKQFHNEFPQSAMVRLYFGMESFNSAGRFADRFWEDGEKFAEAEARIMEVFEEFPSLKEALPEIFRIVADKDRSGGFTEKEIKNLQRNPIFRKDEDG